MMMNVNLNAKDVQQRSMALLSTITSSVWIADAEFFVLFAIRRFTLKEFTNSI
jgi:hypothetical protein